MGSILGFIRSLVPLMSSKVFSQHSYSAKLAYIVTFGIAKASCNLIAGPINDRFGRKRSLVTGFLLGVPVPLVIIFAQSWNVVLLATCVLGFSQGFVGSGLIVMVVDIFGADRKGTAVGICECVIYSTVAGISLIAIELAQRYGYRPLPFVVATIINVFGVVMALIIKDTKDIVAAQAAKIHESAVSCADSEAATTELVRAEANATPGFIPPPTAPMLPKLDIRATVRDLVRNKNYLLLCVCGHVDKFKDGICWGGLPLWFSETNNLPATDVAMLLTVYPITWGVTQLVTGGLSDLLGRKLLLTAGYAINGAALLIMVAVPSYAPSPGLKVFCFFCTSFCIGIGTALIYPTMQAASTDEAPVLARAIALGGYKFSRDIGYAVGALVSGWVADWLGLKAAFSAVGALLLMTAASILIFYTNRALDKAPAPLKAATTSPDVVELVASSVAADSLVEDKEVAAANNGHHVALTDEVER